MLSTRITQKSGLEGAAGVEAPRNSKARIGRVRFIGMGSSGVIAANRRQRHQTTTRTARREEATHRKLSVFVSFHSPVNESPATVVIGVEMASKRDCPLDDSCLEHHVSDMESLYDV